MSQSDYKPIAPRHTGRTRSDEITQAAARRQCGGGFADQVTRPATPRQPMGDGPINAYVRQINPDLQ